MNKSNLMTLKRVADAVNEHYEPFGHIHCYRAVWRKVIYPEMGLSFRTFCRYLAKAKEIHLCKCKDEF